MTQKTLFKLHEGNWGLTHRYVEITNDDGTKRYVVWTEDGLKGTINNYYIDSLEKVMEEKSQLLENADGESWYEVGAGHTLPVDCTVCGFGIRGGKCECTLNDKQGV
jgi:hypothetical protein